MSVSKRISRWAVLLFVIAAFTGCGTPPVGPAAVGSGGSGGGGGDPSPVRLGPEVLVVHPDGTTSWTQVPPGGGPYPAGTTSGPGSSGSKIEATAWMDGSKGGTLQCGRFYLTVPAGAFDGPGTITMTMEDSTVMVCDLAIHPEDLNRFNQPVYLALCTNGTNVSTDTLSIYWHDDDKNEWVDMGCDRDLSDNPETAGTAYPANMRGVMTTLSHFSRYSGGKAGW